jgi:hypothetical protein
MKFEKAWLREFICTTVGQTCPETGATLVRNDICGKSRWNIINEFVFSTKDGKYFGGSYSYGATENQDNAPFEYEPDEVELAELESYEEMVTKYRPVTDKGDVPVSA